MPPIECRYNAFRDWSVSPHPFFKDARSNRIVFCSWFSLYKGSPGGEEIVKRFANVNCITCDLYYLQNKNFSRRVEELSKKKSVSMAQIATAWVLAKDGVSAPIVGTTSLKNLEDIIGTHIVTFSRYNHILTKCSLAAVHVSLSEDELKFLEEPYKPSPVLGHWSSFNCSLSKEPFRFIVWPMYWQ